MFNKFIGDRFGSCTTFESEPHNYEAKNNRMRVGNDLKNHWSQKMKEFELSAKKLLSGGMNGRSEQLN